MKQLDLKVTLTGALLVTTCLGAEAKPQAKKGGDTPPNIILFTADDLGYVSLGCYGCGVKDVTPNLDKFAAEGVLFNNGYVNAAISAPSRRIMATGMYGHNSGAMGFSYIDESRNVPVLMDILKESGYKRGVLGKVDHSSPTKDYGWDFIVDYGDLGRGRSPRLYAESAKRFIKECQREDKPFYFMVNSHDPHRPYHNPDDPRALANGAEAPTRLFSPEEIEVPGFIPDTEMVRTEISHYYNSTRRLDDTFGAVMAVLEELDCRENTLIIFISDNGIAVPFAKANTYYASNRVPFVVQWQGKVKGGRVNNDSFVAGVDILPTVLDAVGLDAPQGIDGSSFKSALLEKKSSHKDYAYNQIDSKIGGPPVPMRTIITENYSYIFNAWSDGKRTYKNNNEGDTMVSMVALAESGDEAMKARLDLYRHRVMEEFYDLKRDPNSLNNLINDPAYKDVIDEYRTRLDRTMVEHNDLLLETFRARGDFATKEQKLIEAYPKFTPREHPNAKSTTTRTRTRPNAKAKSTESAE